MEVRFYLDPQTDQPHIYGHGVSEAEVEQIFRGSGRSPGLRRREMKAGPD